MGSHQDRFHGIQTISLFSGLDEVQISLILESAQCRKLRAAEMLFTQGQKAEQFFWLKSGLLKLNRISPTGEEKIIEIIRPGHIFAEAIMFMGEPVCYPVNAQLIEDSELWCFSNQDFRKVLHDSVDTCFRLMAGLSQRLHKHVNEIERLTLQTATERVVGYLLQQSSEEVNHVQLSIAKQTLASQLSIKPETLSRIFSRLSKEGLIAINKNEIELLDVAGLRRKVEI